jgi:non-specific serine/threonine protein kinase
MPTARSGHAAVVAGGRLIVFGGEELDGGTTIEQVEAYDPRTREWSEVPAMITPRHGVGGVARGGRIYAVEGGPQPGLFFSSALEYLDVE